MRDQETRTAEAAELASSLGWVDGYDVLDKGFVVLDDYMGGDLSVVNGARVSFAKRSSGLDDSGTGLIRYLMKSKHGSPFEHNAFSFRVKCPIFVAREWFRHRIGSFNEWSGRYSKMEPEFYIPEYVRTQVGKPGAYKFEPIDADKAEMARETMENLYRRAWEEYDYLLRLGVAKELASRVLPLALYTQFVWTVNARSLMNYLSLRNSAFAQYEIAQYAEKIEALWSNVMPVTHEAFVSNERVAP